MTYDIFIFWYVFIFFLLKHKTAYEMRISEWSSTCALPISFETAVARGRGHVRLRNGKCWTLLTTMAELKGHEEPKGERRDMGARRSEERCVGKESVSTCRSRWSPNH